MPAETPGPWGVYVHVPFCLRRCGYCDFATSAVPADPTDRERAVSTYLAAVRAEILATPARLARTVYCGGGTPTVLPAAALVGLLDLLRGHGGVAVDAEITCEANPTTAEVTGFQTLRAGGFNRLSLGAQSFADRLLAILGRTHTASEVDQAVAAARGAGFTNLSLDLMFGLPDQTLADWQRDLDAALALSPEHLSLYGLTIEPGTPFATAARHGRLALPDEGVQADMFEWAMDCLPAAGFEHYEIASFAVPGFASRHNLIYWHNEQYRGFGPGAASYVGRQRWTNLADVREYTKQVAAGSSLVAEAEERSVREEQRDALFVGLRRLAGVDQEWFEQRYGEKLEEVFGRELANLMQRGLLERIGSCWRLTRRGVLLANQVFMEFV